MTPSVRAHLSSLRRHQRTHHIAQVEEADCGAACLAMILAYHGRFVSHSELRDVCGGGRDGLSVAALARAAGKYGLSVAAKRVRLCGERSTRSADMTILRSLVTSPVIVVVRGRHFAVLDSVSSRRRLAVLDPAAGRASLPVDEFAETFSGVVVTFEPGPEFRPGGVRPSVRRDVIEWLGLLVRLVVLAVVAGVAASGGTVAAAFAVRGVVQHLAQTQGVGGVGAPGAVLVGAALAVAVATWSYQRLLSEILLRLALTRSDVLVRRLLRLPSSLVHRSFTGALAARVQSADTTAMQITSAVLPGMVNLVVVIVVSCVLFVLSPLLALVALANTAVVGLLLRTAARGDSARQTQLLAAEVTKDGVTLNGLTMPEILKAEGATAGLFDAWAEAQGTCLELTHRSARWTQWFSGPATALGSVTSVLVIVVGALLVSHQRLSIGDLVATIALVGVLGGAASAVGQSGLGIARLRASLTMVTDVTDVTDGTLVDDECNEGADTAATLTSPATPGAVGAELALELVTFGYDTNRAPALTNVSLCLAPGERVTVVGPTGCGKSTLAKVAAGVAQPWTGSVRINGQPMGGSTRDLVGYVAQKPLFLEGSVAENVALGATTIDEHALAGALRAAEMATVVERRGGPFHATVSHGGDNFSGGERQRLALARALYRRPGLLVLDEATSSLDGPLARRIEDTLRTLGITTLAVAHRLDAVRPGDRIIAVDSSGVRELTDRAAATDDRSPVHEDTRMRVAS